MKIKSYSKVLSALAISSLLLAACSDDTEKSSTKEKKGKDVEQVDTSKFPTKTTNQGEAMEGGHLTYGLVSDTPFEGILNKAFSQGAPDHEIFTFMDDEDLLDTDENYVYNNEGAATYELSEDYKTFTLNIRDNVNWQDGKPVTGADLEYAYLVIASKDYKGPVYDPEQMEKIKGMKEYHEGKADKISGIKVEGKKITFTFTEANPSVKTGLWVYPLHKEYLSDVPIAKMESSDKIRKKPIGFGPFKVKKIVQGEAVEFEANKDYWRGAPKLDSVTLKVVNPSVAVKSLEKGDLDVAEITPDLYDQAKALGNVQILGKIDLAYSYIGFHMGHYDEKKGENVMDNPKFQDKRLRQAMAYAINNEEVGEKMYKGLRFPANSVITPNFKYNNKDLKPYKYDPEKAKKLLDDAGFKDTNKDGLREDPDGKEFKLNFASMSGSDIAEPLTKYYIQQWQQVGLDVQMLDGRLHEFNSFYDLLKKDNEEVDIYQAAWAVASDPDPSGIWGRTALYNYTRWTNEKNDELLAKGVSEEAFDDQYRIDTYNEWQELIHEEVPMIPTLFRYTMTGVNERVTGYDYLAAGQYQWHNVGVTK
ncbi:oligopeptide ABC transporter substrate-binding protein [Peribacillus sp. NPDC006672]|uniref:oligopeptide ABC transporter substrate-binding protein n=1 Tax=Peribacillus sp. NPDC006672 TaxID=3390606 RepID=UPI003D08EEC9